VCWCVRSNAPLQLQKKKERKNAELDCKLNLLNKKQKAIQLAEFCRFRSSDVPAYRDSDYRICFVLSDSVYQDILLSQLIRPHISFTCPAHCILTPGNSIRKKKNLNLFRKKCPSFDYLLQPSYLQIFSVTFSSEIILNPILGTLRIQ